MSKVTPDLLGKIADEVTPKDGSFEVTTLGNPQCLCNVDRWLPSGCIPINLITGGGYPVGRITEIYGDNSTGKSLLATHAVIEAQHQDFLTIFVDTESAVSAPLMEQLGVDLDTLLYLTPNTVSDVFDTLEKVLDKKDKSKELGKEHPALFVWDTVAATTTQEEMDIIQRDGLDKKQFSEAALQISRALRSGWSRRFARSNVCAIFVNQIRERPGVMFGDPHGTFGGKAIPFYATLRLELTSKRLIKDAGQAVGIDVQVYVKKNKTFPPFRKVEVPVLFGWGIDDAQATLNMAEKDLGLAKKSGGWYTMVLAGEERKFQGQTWCEVDGLFDTHYDEIATLMQEAYYGKR